MGFSIYTFGIFALLLLYIIKHSLHVWRYGDLCKRAHIRHDGLAYSGKVQVALNSSTGHDTLKQMTNI